MTTINTAAAGHASKSETYAGGLTVNYNVFPNATAADKKRLRKIERGHKIVDNLNGKIDLTGPCNRYFKTLGKGTSFRTLWSDKTIFINFSPSVSVGFYGATHSNDKDIAISAWVLDNKNRWMVAATIVHELAHIAGAAGGASHKAEKAVDKCYFDEQYDSTIMGSIQDIETIMRRLA